MRILIDDGSRHTQLTGYGNLSRAIITALSKHTDAELAVRHRLEDLPEWTPHKAVVESLPVVAHPKDYDVVLRISSPGGAAGNAVPTVIYTQNALGDLLPEWREKLALAQGVIVPGEFDAQVFRRYLDNVHVCPQHVENATFRPMPKYRAEGVDCPSFFFVGSYSYRKGVDIMLAALGEAFGPGDEVHLGMHCFNGLEKSGADDALKRIRALPANIRVSLFNGSLTPTWMARLYNRHDAVVSFSRGEGWCMPLHEGLLSGKPVIAPDCTAMGECLPQTGVRRVAVDERLISDVKDPLGGGLRNRYGFEGNTMWEAQAEDAAASFRDVYDNLDTYTTAAAQGREAVLQNFSKEVMAKKIMTALESVL